MLDKNTFDPEKISIIEFRMAKGEVETPENFDHSKIEGHHIENELQIGFNLDKKLVKADFTIEIKTKSKGQKETESIGKFHLVFIYHVENLEELASPDKNNLIALQPALGNTLSSVTYSTSRGILLTRLQGTALQNFILPIINPNKLLK
jgi:hypothetical protein